MILYPNKFRTLPFSCFTLSSLFLIKQRGCKEGSLFVGKGKDCTKRQNKTCYAISFSFREIPFGPARISKKKTVDRSPLREKLGLIPLLSQREKQPSYISCLRRAKRPLLLLNLFLGPSYLKGKSTVAKGCFAALLNKTTSFPFPFKRAVNEAYRKEEKKRNIQEAFFGRGKGDKGASLAQKSTKVKLSLPPTEQKRASLSTQESRLSSSFGQKQPHTTSEAGGAFATRTPLDPFGKSGAVPSESYKLLSKKSRNERARLSRLSIKEGGSILALQGIREREKKKVSPSPTGGGLVSFLKATEYSLETFHRSNQDTCLLHNPAVSEGDWVESGDLLADCAASSGGELALGKNILVAYMPWEGYNFEDAILISERLVVEDVYSSVHIERYDIEIRETQYGMEVITRNIPASQDQEHLDSNGVAKLGSLIEESVVLVGRMTPINKKIQSTYKNLLYSILQTKPDSFRDTSLRAPRGMKGKIVNVQIYSTKANPPLQDSPKKNSRKLPSPKRKKGDSKKDKLTPIPNDLKTNKVRGDSYNPASPASLLKKSDGVVDMTSPLRGGEGALLSLSQGRGRAARGSSFPSSPVATHSYDTQGIRSETIEVPFLSHLKDESLLGKIDKKNLSILETSPGKNSFGLCVAYQRPSSLDYASILIAKSKRLSFSQRSRPYFIKWASIAVKEAAGNRGAVEEKRSFFSRIDRKKKVPSPSLLRSVKKSNLGGNLFLNLKEGDRAFFKIKKIRDPSREPINKKGSNFSKGSLKKEREKQRKDALTRQKTWPSSLLIKEIKPSLEKALDAQKLEDSSLPFPTETSPQRGEVAIINKVYVYLAEKRKIQVGDKMAGRHGNKGIVSQILPRQDMPFLSDGTPIDMVLNPLGVPSRMNVGQIYECLLGLAAKYLGEHYKVFPFDEIYGAEASRSFVYSKLYEARKKTGNNWLFNPNCPGKVRLFDGQTGDPFDQTVTVGYAYMLKLVHLVDDKIHMRSTGPYSLITQQPLRGRSKQGGQRLGEMEVWALEGYGAAFTLLEMLTIKSDDMTGRMTLWSNLILNKGISIGTPESFKVLVCELQALCLDIGIFRLRPGSDFDEIEIESLTDLP